MRQCSPKVLRQRSCKWIVSCCFTELSGKTDLASQQPLELRGLKKGGEVRLGPQTLALRSFQGALNKVGQDCT